MAELAPLKQLRIFLGVDKDPETDALIKNLRGNALDEIRRATGFDWTTVGSKKSGAANELIQVMVYLSYYGVRDGVGNTEFLLKRRTQLMKQLQYSEEVLDGLRSKSPDSDANQNL